MEAPAMWRGTSVQVCGLWPFSAGSGSPSIGAPLGQNLITGVTVCGDPISWFTRAHLITPAALTPLLELAMQADKHAIRLRNTAIAIKGGGAEQSTAYLGLPVKVATTAAHAHARTPRISRAATAAGTGSAALTARKRTPQAERERR